MLVNFILSDGQDGLDYALRYNGKTAQQTLDDTANALGLNKDDIENALKVAGKEDQIQWASSTSTASSSSGGSGSGKTYKEDVLSVANSIIVTVKPATVLPHQALSCNNRNKTKVYDCRPLYSIGFDRIRIAWEWYCVKGPQGCQGKQQSRGVVAAGRGLPQQRIERACLVRAKRHCRQHFSLSSAKGMERSAAA